MTCHLALTGLAGTVMVSDSQGSDSFSETHGFQKQYVGPDFLIGGAGAGDIIHALFEALASAKVTSATLETFVASFVDNELTKEAKSSVSFLIACGQAPNNIFEFAPGTFRRLRKRQNFYSIGSGSDFVFRALARDQVIGIEVGDPITIAETLVIAETYIDAANESLTVDDLFLIGILANGRSYVMGDERISPNHLDQTLQKNWGTASSKYMQMLAVLKTIRGELQVAQQLFDGVRRGDFPKTSYPVIAAAADSIRHNRKQLEVMIEHYFHWYDAIISPSLPFP